MKITITKEYDLKLFIHQNYPDGFTGDKCLYVAGRDSMGIWFFIYKDGSPREAEFEKFKNFDYFIEKRIWKEIEKLPWE